MPDHKGDFMLLRKRAWDIMRDEYASVREDASMSETIRVLRESRTKQPDNAFVLVFSKTDRFVGVVSMWNLVQGIGPCLLKATATEEAEVDWDKAFSMACRNCSTIGIKDFLQTDVPILKPNDPMGRVLEILLDYRRGRAVVEEGGRIIGVVLLADLFREIGDYMDM